MDGSKLLDIVLISKEEHRKFQKSEISLFFLAFFVGIVQVSLFVFDKFYKYFPEGFSSNSVLNALMWGIISFNVGILNLMIFSLPFYDTIRNIKKRKYEIEKRINKIFISKNENVNLDLNKENSFLTEKQEVHDKNLEIVIKSYTLLHIPILLRVVIGLVILISNFDKFNTIVELILVGFLLILPIWGIFIFMRSMGLYLTFSKFEKNFLFIFAYIWISIIEVLFYKLIPLALDFLMTYK